ncbi:MAG TPA: hypothetical protein VK835_08935 [Bacteroidia bacterium]|jgi:hypothetical protein|nr:hypothetical protein [Bacteroidia bacterium]
MKFQYYCVFAILVLFFSCKKDATIAPPDLGYNYYPGKIRSYVIYDVDSIFYNQNNGDTLKLKFQIKEVMDTLITDNQNRPTIKLIRYKKVYSPTVPYSAMSWTLQDVWVANKTATDVEVVEENIRYTKLAFPAKLSATWNGTAHADTTEQDYKYTSFDNALTLNGNSFSKALTVQQHLDTNALYYQNYYEQYARNVGLVYKQIVNYVYKQDNQGVHRGVIAGGVYYVMTVNSYGTE